MNLKHLACAFLLILCSCSKQYVTLDRYHDLPMGASPKQVEQQLGSPYRVTQSNRGVEYLYIERIYLNKDDRLQRHYSLLFVNDQLSDKTVKELEQGSIQSSF